MESVKRIGIHCVDVPPSHADEINMGIRKSYLVKQNKDKPFNLGDNVCFIEICCGRPCDASDGFKITSLVSCKGNCFLQVAEEFASMR